MKKVLEARRQQLLTELAQIERQLAAARKQMNRLEGKLAQAQPPQRKAA